MALNRQGINTGLLGYSLKKEFLGDTLYFRETQVFTYELFVMDMLSGSPKNLHDAIYTDFRNRYSGDIYVKMFDVPTDYYFPNDSIHVAKYRVSVEVKSSPSGVPVSQAELTGNYFSGIDGNFWQTYGPTLLDFREEFGFEQGDNGTQNFYHNLGFNLITGTRQRAVTIASGIFARDKDTTFGITAMVGGVSVADTGTYQDYFTEVYDTIRQSYNFTKKREILPLSGASGVYSLNHTMDFKEDGTFDISEKGEVKGKLNFPQAQATMESLYGNAYTRCNSFYTNYVGLTTVVSPLSLVNLPVRTVKSFNRQSLQAEYDVTYTTNPLFNANGTSTEEVFDLQANEINIVDLKHSFNFTANRRLMTTDFATLIANATGVTSGRAANYYSLQGALYTPSLPLKQVKYDLNWPNRDTRGSITFNYTNNPKYFVTIGGLPFKYVDSKVQHTKPVDITNEYKIINRPQKQSVINYAYQTEKGQYVVTVEGGLGRNPNEFSTGFRSGYGDSIVALYRYGVGIFMNEFVSTIPTSFTYFLSDMKYSINQDGVLIVVLTFTYTLKKYRL